MAPHRTLTAALVLCASVTLDMAIPFRATAQHAELILQWRAPAECAGKAAVEQRVAALLGRPLSPDTARSLRAHAEVVHDGQGYRLELQTRDGETGGERTLHANDCEQLVEVTALVLALAVDPQRVVAASPDAAALPPPTEETDSQGSTHAPDPSPSPPATPWQWGVGIAALLSWGDLPSAAPGVLGSLAATNGRLRVSLDARGWPPRTATQEDVSVNVKLWSVGALGCVRALGSPTLSLSPCVGAEAGRLTGEGTGGGLAERNVRHKPWAAALVSLRGAWQAARWLSLSLEAGLSAPLTRPRFVVDSADGGTTTGLHRPASVGLRTALGAELTF